MSPTGHSLSDAAAQAAGVIACTMGYAAEPPPLRTDSLANARRLLDATGPRDTRRASSAPGRSGCGKPLEAAKPARARNPAVATGPGSEPSCERQNLRLDSAYSEHVVEILFVVIRPVEMLPMIPEENGLRSASRAICLKRCHCSPSPRRVQPAFAGRRDVEVPRSHSLIPCATSFATSCSCVPEPFMELQAAQSS